MSGGAVLNRDGHGRLATINILEEASRRLHLAMSSVQLLGTTAAAAAPPQLDDLSLTLAALDRLVTTYVHQLLKSQGQDVSSQLSKSASAHNLDRGLDMLRAQPSSRGEVLHPHKGGFGGADSLLMYLCHALATTNKCLDAATISSPWQTLRYRGLAAVLGLWALVLPLPSSSSRSLARVSRRLRCLSALVVLWLARGVHRWLWRRSLEKSQRQLWIVVRMWVIVEYVKTYATLRKDAGVRHQTLIARPTLDDYSAWLKWRSRRLLETVPPTSESAFWYEEASAVALFRRGMDLLYASCGTGLEWSHWGGTRRPLLGYAAAYVSGLCYSLRPSLAAKRAAAVMSKANLQVLQTAWGQVDNPLCRWGAASLARIKGLRSQHYLEVGGLKCHLLSVGNEPPIVRVQQQQEEEEEEEEEREVVMFCHGGGYVSHLHCIDMPVLTAWAKRLGPSAVVVVPEYTLLPEGRFPLPTNELLGVYRAIARGGLGFVPRKIVLAGESAGGNLAVSVLVCLIIQQDGKGWMAGGNFTLYDKQLAAEEEEEEEEEEGGGHEDAAVAAKGRRRRGSSTVHDGIMMDLFKDDEEAPSARLPDGMVLFYPVVNFSLSPSPSRTVHLSDPILPLGILNAITKAYTSGMTDPTKDPRLSPYFSSEAILSRFPPVFMGVGGFDPLLDDTIDFDVRLEKAGAQSTLRLARDLPHGFFGLYGIEASATDIIHESADYLADILLPPPNTTTTAAS